MGLALSTSWNAFRYDDALKMVGEITALGFKEVELSFNLTTAIVRQIQDLTATSKIKVTSVHNFCPIPNGAARDNCLPDHYSMASGDEEERKKAVFYTKRSIDAASELGAKAVVLHCGRVEIPDRTRELIDFLIRVQIDTPAYRALKTEVLKERDEHAALHLKQALRSLEELQRYASDKQVLLGVENRYYYREIPSFEEISILLDHFAGSTVFYWHDVGHAQFLENLGIAKHKEYLQRYANAMIGMHLHDITGYHDHKAPLCGSFDFTFLKPYLKEETIKVLEAHYPATRAELQKSKKYLEKILDGKL